MLVSISFIYPCVELGALLGRRLIAIGEIRNGPERREQALPSVVDRTKDHSISVFSCVHVSTLKAKFLWKTHCLASSIHEQACTPETASRFRITMGSLAHGFGIRPRFCRTLSLWHFPLMIYIMQYITMNLESQVVPCVSALYRGQYLYDKSFLQAHDQNRATHLDFY